MNILEDSSKLCSINGLLRLSNCIILDKNGLHGLPFSSTFLCLKCLNKDA